MTLANIPQTRASAIPSLLQAIGDESQCVTLRACPCGYWGGIRDELPGDDHVDSANFHADHARKHESGFYTEDLMISVPNKEYLFKTVSSLGETAAFGLDFGEIYKLDVTSAKLLTRRRIVVAAKANIPTEMAMKLIREWNQRGYGMDVVLYKKCGGSTHADPNEEGPIGTLFGEAADTTHLYDFTSGGDKR